MMRFIQSTRHAIRLAAVAAVLAVATTAVHAQQPSAAALATAKDVVNATGATTLFNPLISGVIEQSKILYLQQNPALSKDLNEIGNKMRTDMAPRFSQLSDEVARIYATRFSEQELKDILAFYKSPSGQKMLVEQPKVIDASVKFAQDWATKLSEEVVGGMREELKKRGKSP